MLTLSLIFKMLKIMKILSQKNIKIAFLVVLITNLFLLIIDLVSRLLFLEVKMLLLKTKKHLKKNFIMTDEEEHFQSCNTCRICEKAIDDKNVRDHSHISEKFRGVTHWSCRINFS